MKITVLIPSNMPLEDVIMMFKKIDMVLLYEQNEFIAVHKNARGIDGKKIGEDEKITDERST